MFYILFELSFADVWLEYIVCCWCLTRWFRMFYILIEFIVCWCLPRISRLLLMFDYNLSYILCFISDSNLSYIMCLTRLYRIFISNSYLSYVSYLIRIDRTFYVWLEFIVCCWCLIQIYRIFYIWLECIVYVIYD